MHPPCDGAHSPHFKWSIKSLQLSLPSHATQGSLEIEKVSQLYSDLYEISPTGLEAASVYFKYITISLNNKVIASFSSRFASSSTVYVTWDTSLFGEPSDLHYSAALVMPTKDFIRPAKNLCHSVYIDSVIHSHLLVYLYLVQLPS